MRAKILITLCFALSFCVEVYAEAELEVKRAVFPYMAFIYYPDETIVDTTGMRFLRGAVLIRPDWLITSAVGPSLITDGPKGFPQKTLLARAGATTIDAKFSLNEDEDEQEREIIQIVRPYNHSATQWWHTDISLMKTLLPFNMTSAVYVTTLNHRLEYIEKTCTILVYARKMDNSSADRALMQLTVELQPPSITNCGPHFLEETMACAKDSEETKNALYDSLNFCQGNSGGPLICESEVMGLQTYIDNNCEPPHLYQVLTAWDNFISCGTEEKCDEELCSKVCEVANKDPVHKQIDALVTPTTKEEITTTTTALSDMAVSASAPETVVVSSNNNISDEKMQPSAPHEYMASLYEAPVEQSSLINVPAEPVTAESFIQSTVEENVPDIIITADQHTTSDRPITYARIPSTSEYVTENSNWPKERITPKVDVENTSRKTKVEAQQQNVKMTRSFGQTIGLNHNFLFGCFILKYFI